MSGKKTVASIRSQQRARRRDRLIREAVFREFLRMPQGLNQASSGFNRFVARGSPEFIDHEWRDLSRQPEQFNDEVNRELLDVSDNNSGQGRSCSDQEHSCPDQGGSCRDQGSSCRDQGSSCPKHPPEQDMSPDANPIQGESGDMIEDWPPNPQEETQDADIGGGGGGGMI